MISEHDYYVGLEVQHNVVALDIDAIKPWAEAPINPDTPEHRYTRIGEALYLTVKRLESLQDHETDDEESLLSIRKDLSFERSFQGLLVGIEQEARETVRARGFRH